MRDPSGWAGLLERLPPMSRTGSGWRISGRIGLLEQLHVAGEVADDRVGGGVLGEPIDLGSDALDGGGELVLVLVADLGLIVGGESGEGAGLGGDGGGE